MRKKDKTVEYKKAFGLSAASFIFLFILVSEVIYLKLTALRTGMSRPTLVQGAESVQRVKK